MPSIASYTITALMGALSHAYTMKFGVISDIHYDPLYDPTIPGEFTDSDGVRKSFYCNRRQEFNEVKSNEIVVQEAHFGRIRCDSSYR